MYYYFNGYYWQFCYWSLNDTQSVTHVPIEGTETIYDNIEVFAYYCAFNCCFYDPSQPTYRWFDYNSSSQDDWFVSVESDIITEESRYFCIYFLTPQSKYDSYLLNPEDASVIISSQQSVNTSYSTAVQYFSLSDEFLGRKAKIYISPNRYEVKAEIVD